MKQFTHGLTLFFSLLLEALPFLMLGIAVSSLLLVFVDAQRLSARFPRHPVLAAIVGSCLGMVIPVCQYGNVPVARRLIIGGVPIPAATAFLVAAPTVNPMVIWLTGLAFPNLPQIGVFRVAFALLMAMVIGCVFGAYRQREDASKRLPSILLSGTVRQPHQEDKPRRTSKLSQSRWLQFLDNFRQEFLPLGAVLVVGCAIAAVVQTFVSPAAIFALGQGNVTSIIAFLLFGSVLSIGSTADADFVSTLITAYTNGALLAFLLISVVDLKVICLLFSVFRPKVVITLIILTALLTFLFALICDFYL